jgi:hypothetical protein
MSSSVSDTLLFFKEVIPMAKKKRATKKAGKKKAGRKKARRKARRM